MGLSGIFKKAGQVKKKTEQAGDKGEKPDKSLYRIGVYGHKGVGKTVFFTIVYAFSKKQEDFEIMALGETQEILEEKFNLMRGKGMDLKTGQAIDSRRFPPLSTGEQKLDFEVRVGENTIVPVTTMDYSGELIYIDTRGELKQSLIDFFKNCECVLFFIDPEGLGNEAERSNRIAAFTDLIAQLSGRDKRLKMPVGLVITKSDELASFKSAEQSVVIGMGNGYIRALNFAGFLRGVLKQRHVASRPEWKNELELILNRLESFFKPLLNRTMDFQVFFVSSTGNSPDIIADPSGDKIKVPPQDLRPLGVSFPLRWAIRRISSYRQSIIHRTILKWTFLIVALIINLVALVNIYNGIKIRSLIWDIKNIGGAYSEVNKAIADRYEKYANNIIIKLFFREFSSKTLAEAKYFRTIGANQAHSELEKQFKAIITTLDNKIAGLNVQDTTAYNKELLSVDSLFMKADQIAQSVSDQSLKKTMSDQISIRKQRRTDLPTSANLAARQSLTNDYQQLVRDFRDRLAMLDYDYLLNKDKFPATLQAFKDSKLAPLVNDPTAASYSRKITAYLDGVTTIERGTILIPFKIIGADGGQSGYTISFVGAQAQEFSPGDLESSRTDLQVRVPVKSQNVQIVLSKAGTPVPGGVYPINPGYHILTLNGQKIPFVDKNINIQLIFDLAEFHSYFKDKL
jgi:hypothetical protein